MGHETHLLPPPPTTPSTATYTSPPPLPLSVVAPRLSSAASGSTSLIVAGAASSTPSPTSLAPGFRFHPTDEELVIYYLKRKVGGKSFRFDAISEVDIYHSEPWDLADKSRLKTRDQEWYFFSALDKKYGNGGRMNRATNKGYWKATGNDRPVMHEQRTVGLKKTLVFHSGRAPDGKRTNWVMHEYRLVDEELEKARTANGSTQDAFVLCRIFHKNNIGPPNGQRYAPFVEEEWDDEPGLVPRAKSAEPIPISQQPCVDRVLCIEGRKDVEQDTQSVTKAPFDVNKLPIETQNLLAVCKRESMAEFSSPEKEDSKLMPDEYPSPQPDNHKAFSQIYKRRRYNLNNHLNASGDSIRTSQDPCSSTITTAATTLPTETAFTNPTTTNTAPKKHFLSALVEFSLMESLESKEVQSPDFNADNLELTVPPSSVKFIKHLQSEMQKLSVEKEAMRFEMMSSQAMVNILQSRIDHLNKENEELKKMV
ncbi:PREDICTED: NAC domain-containing protein 13-like [Lupinus angustifolius]|uniref:NAC domain-containing protein 13-like n=1 Tax=Lupinus angustifolius TaxID=3871 RepID=UPI00092F7A29|nr:PREDICTED: NAC domain-containing protein 13-like [Lupinus angustifolius]